MTRLSLLWILLTTFTVAIGQDRSRQLNLDSDKLAIEGYDPVAYFTGKKAVEGKKNITHEYEGAVYRFASQQNKQLFISAPATYVPQYGGWCAYAMGAKGEKVEVDPETFKIVDGKLYLFYNKFFNNTLDTWNKDENALQSKADKNWKALTNR